VTNFFSGLAQDIGSLNQPGGTVGSEQPEWDFPMGQDRVADDVLGAFFRGDAGPTGLNEFLQKQPPEVVDRFRAYVNMGIIRPKNAAAGNIVKGYGGLRAGDAVGPGGVLGPLQDDKPSGMTADYWAQANNLISTMVNAKLEAAKQSGYLDGVPTMQREEMLQQIAQGWKDRFTEEFKAKETQRSNQANEGLSQQEINNQNLQAMAQTMGGVVGADGTFQQSEEGRQFDVESGGWMSNGQATLGREQQAWNQAKDVAALASNPRNYMEAQMLGSARGGLGGMDPSNQINAQRTQTGQAPPGSLPGAGGTGWNPAQWDASKGQMGAGQNPLASTQAPGTSGAGTMAAEGPPGAQDGQTPPGLNPEQWSGWLNNAQKMQDTARQAMMGGQAGAPGAASGLSPGPGSPQMGQNYPGFQGMDGADGKVGIEPWQMGGDAEARKRALMAGQMPQGGAMNGIEPWQAGQQPRTLPQSGDGQMQTGEWRGGQGFQMPGARQGQQAGPALGGPGAMPGQRPMGMAQPGTQLGQQPQGQQFTTSAFTQALLKNRAVPNAGALQNQGAYMTQQQMQKEINPSKVRGQDFLRGRDSEQKGFLANTSAAGYSDEDALGAMQKNAAPAFKAPTAGRMV
jgi:hypothetical protein